MTEQHQPTSLTPEEQVVESAIHDLSYEITCSLIDTVRDQILTRGVKVAAPALAIALGRALASVVCVVVEEQAQLALIEMHAIALGRSMGKFGAIMKELQEAA